MSEAAPTVAPAAHDDALTDEVAAAAAAGGEWAWAIVHDVLAPPLQRYFRGKGIDAYEDATSDVFLRMIRSIDRFDGTASELRSWVFAIAHNLVIDEYRKRDTRRAHAAAEPGEEAPGRAEPQADVATSELVVQLLRQLPRAQQEVMLLRIHGDLELHAIAHVLGMRLGKVTSLHRRALARLRDTAPRFGLPAPA